MEEIIDYVMKTPENTNGNILREKLQKMGGSGGGVMVVDCFYDENDELTATMTAGEIFEAIESKNVVFKVLRDTDIVEYHLLMFATNKNKFMFHTYDFGEYMIFIADSANDYPVVSGR